MGLKLLLSPLAQGAYFDDRVAVAEAELAAMLPGAEVTVDERATATFLDVALPEEAAAEAMRCSFVQAVFAPIEGGMRLLDVSAGHEGPASLVWGAKYRGKTHELVTLLALNLARAVCTAPPPHRVLDPMAGRGTTLFWALRLGLDAWGVELDPRALDDFQRHVKQQAKRHRLKHEQRQGSVGPKRKDGGGRFLEYRLADRTLKLIAGDSRDLRQLVGPAPFAMMVTDLPYGVQHVGPRGTRDPLATIAACAPGWAEALAPGGALVLVYNRKMTSRVSLIGVFEGLELELHPFEAPHRMSESIVRDLLVLHRPTGG